MVRGVSAGDDGIVAVGLILRGSGVALQGRALVAVLSTKKPLTGNNFSDTPKLTLSAATKAPLRRFRSPMM